MCKTWAKIHTRIGIVLMPIRIWIWIGINMELWNRIRISIKTMPIYNTVYDSGMGASPKNGKCPLFSDNKMLHQVNKNHVIINVADPGCLSGS